MHKRSDSDAPPNKFMGVLYSIAAGVVVYETVQVSGATPNLTMICLFMAEAFGAYLLDDYRTTAAQVTGAAVAASFSTNITLKTIALAGVSTAGVFEVGYALASVFLL